MMLKILLYRVGWLTFPDPFPECEVFDDLGRIEEAHAVIFHLPTLPAFRDIRKYPGQIWVACSMESDVCYPMLRHPPFMARFDLTMPYRLDSDVPIVYFDRPRLCQELMQLPLPKTEAAPCVYFGSNDQDHCQRLEYARELMTFIAVDSYGKSLRNRVLPDDLGRETKMATIPRYRFNLAFENSLTHDYVSEKFFDPLIAGCVPVYRGAPNIADFAPGEKCYVDTSDFAGPKELADFLLWLARNPAEYEKYFEWKHKPLRPAFLDTFSRFSTSPLSRLCSKLRSMGCGEFI